MAPSKTLVAVIFVIGCATGGAASKFVVPPAVAGSNTGKWDYLCENIRADSDDELEDKLKAAGHEGWELVGPLGDTACFKREL